jgi:4-amino-4-deoxy-L-arabinose transferase-like glycosyltransferase
MAGMILKLLKERPIISVLILGGILRLLYLMFYLGDPQWNQLLVDSLFHDYWAQSIADGNILGQEAFFRAPLYIYILGGIYTIFGHSLLAARIFGHICGLLGIFITWKISLQLFSKKTAVVAALIHALYPIAIYFESELLVDSFFTLLIELSVWLFLKAGQERNIRTYILAGLFTGLAIITRPVLMALVPLYLIWIFLSIENKKAAFKTASLLIVIIVLVISPVTLRNLIVSNDFVLVSSSGGINFYIGNNEYAEGYSAAMPPPLGHNWRIKDIRFLAEKETGRIMKASEISQFYYEQGLNWIIQNKTDFIRLYLSKLYLLMNNLEISNNRNLPLFFGSNPILRYNPIRFGIIMSLAVLGIAFLLIKGQMDRWRPFLILFVAGYLLIISMFFINARFRLPVIPFLMILSGYGLTGLYESARKHLLSHKVIIPFLLGACMYWLSHGKVAQVRKDDITSGLFNQANYYLYSDNYNKAMNMYGQVLAINPGYPDANLNLGAAFMKKGIGDSARYYFNRELQASPDNARAWTNLASLYYINEKYDTAGLYIDSALTRKPYLTDALLLKMRILSAKNDTTGLNKTIKQAISLHEENPAVNLEAGIIYSNRKEFNKAEKYLTEVIQAAPAAAEIDDAAFGYSGPAGPVLLQNMKYEAASQLGYIYGIQSRLKESIEMSRRAIEIDSTRAKGYINLINALWLNAGRERAREVLAIARSRFPDDSLLTALSQAIK